MAEKSLNNFKTAMNELMNGKVKTDTESEYISEIEREREDIINTRYTAPEPPSFHSEPLHSEPFRSEPLRSEPLHSEPPTYNEQPAYIEPMENRSAQSGASVLSSDLIIEGNIKSKSDIRLNGYVKGDILCEGALITTGTVDGNVKGIGITMVGCSVNGNVIAKGDLTLDGKSTIIGDVRAAALSVNGKIKGNVSVSGSVVLQGQAIVLGNISAKNISVENGASIKGSMEIRSAAINDEDFTSLPKPAAPAPSRAMEEPEV